MKFGTELVIAPNLCDQVMFCSKMDFPLYGFDTEKAVF